MDDFLDLALARSQRQLNHLARVTMHDIHGVFLSVELKDKDPNSETRWSLGLG